MPLSALLRAVLGPDWTLAPVPPQAPPPDRLTLLLLRHLTDPEVPQELLLHQNRAASLHGLPAASASILASAGLYRERQTDALCHVCGAEHPEDLSAELESLQDLHRPSCTFRLLFKEACSGPPASDEATTDFEPLDRLATDLGRELASVRAQVALELGYAEDAVVLALGRRLRGSQGSYAAAGDLTDDLFAMEFEGTPLSALVVPGSAAAVRRLSPAKSGPSAAAGSPPKGADSKRRRQLFEETTELLMRRRCRVCLEREACYLLVGCGHLVLCESCREDRAQCPLCLQDVSEMMRVYPA